MNPHILKSLKDFPRYLRSGFFRTENHLFGQQGSSSFPILGVHVEFLRKSYAWRLQYLGSRWFQSVWPPTFGGNDPIWQAILLMEEILHHLECNTNYKTLVVYWDKRPTSTGELTRISGCHRSSMFEKRVGFFPHQRSMRIRSKCLK